MIQSMRSANSLPFPTSGTIGAFACLRQSHLGFDEVEHIELV